jgi:hypothetical protein
MNNLRVYFRTFSNQEIRHIDLRPINFSCSEPVKMLDINAGGSGDVTGRFENYSQKANLDLIRDSFGNTVFLRNIPEEVLVDLSKYPETTFCTDSKR